MSYLQGVGVASQASDQFDRLRRGDRMAAMQEEAAQRALEAEKIDAEIFKMATMHMLQRDQAKAAQKRALLGSVKPAAVAVAPQAPEFVPSEGGNYRPLSAYDRPETSYTKDDKVEIDTLKELEALYRKGMIRELPPGMRVQRGGTDRDGMRTQRGGPDGDGMRTPAPMSDKELEDIYNNGLPQRRAKGGEVKADTPKFHGIYDDTLSSGDMPVIWSEMMNDWGTAGYTPYQHLQTAVNDVVRFANGGLVGDIYNGVPMYAEGGEVEAPQGLWGYVKSRIGMKKGGPVPPKKAVDAKRAGKPPTKGGKLKGPGHGTSDSIPASLDGKKGAVALSTGEYVLPKKMVDAIGAENLDRERQKYI